MSSPAVKADMGLMSESAKYVDDLAEKLRIELSALMNRLEKLQDDWQGRSGAKFEELKILFNQKLQLLHSQLQELAALVEGNAQTYITAEEDQLSNLGGTETAILDGRTSNSGGTGIYSTLATKGGYSHA